MVGKRPRQVYITPGASNNCPTIIFFMHKLPAQNFVKNSDNTQMYVKICENMQNRAKTTENTQTSTTHSEESYFLIWNYLNYYMCVISYNLKKKSVGGQKCKFQVGTRLDTKCKTQKKKRLGLERFGHIQVSTHTTTKSIAHMHGAA